MTALSFFPEPRIVAIGASGAQGMADIHSLLESLPDDLDAAVLVVLHRPVNAPSHLCEILGRSSRMPVKVAEQGERWQAGTCYLGEPAAHLALGPNGACRLIDDRQNALRSRTIDVLFCSLAAHSRKRMIGVVLSGSLNDGSVGLMSIKAAGGVVMAVAPSRAERGMPESAAACCSLDAVGSPAELAQEIGLRIGQGNIQSPDPAQQPDRQGPTRRSSVTATFHSRDVAKRGGDFPFRERSALR